MNGFCPADIAEWSELADRSSVPFIPIEPQESFNVTQMLNSWDYQRDVISRVGNISNAHQDKKKLFRLSCCTNTFLRYAMKKGQIYFQDIFRMFNPAVDFHAKDILKKYPHEKVEGFLRPWTQPKIFQKYPVEFKIFVLDNKVKAVSNAYPQRGLPATTEVYDYISEAIFYTHKLIDYQYKPMYMPDYWYHSDLKNQWTVNFMVDEDNNIKLVDGTRPLYDDTGIGCFKSRKDVEGIALKSFNS